MNLVLRHYIELSHLKPYGIGEFYGVGIFAAAKMTHLSRDKTAPKMGHPVVVASSDLATYPVVMAWSDVGHSACIRFMT
jgi:hypothetical protein